MLHYFLRRLCFSLLLLWGVATLVFLLFGLLPGGASRLSKSEKPDPASLAATRKALHLDKAIGTRYGLYLNDLSPIGVTSGKKATQAPVGLRISKLADSNYLSLKAPYLGRSFASNRNVGFVLGSALPRTLVLLLSALLLATILGLAIGMLAAWKKHSFWDTGASAGAAVGLSLPAFFLALLFAYAAGYLQSSYTDVAVKGNVSLPAPLLLGVIALAIRPMAIFIQVSRDAMREVLRQDYIVTAYTNGLRVGRVLLRHALPNALPQLVRALPGIMVELIGGAFFVEFILGWKGIGWITIDALHKMDLPIVMGAVLFIALIFIVFQLLMDLLQRYLDPKLRLS